MYSTALSDPSDVLRRVHGCDMRSSLQTGRLVKLRMIDGTDNQRPSPTPTAGTSSADSFFGPFSIQPRWESDARNLVSQITRSRYQFGSFTEGIARGSSWSKRAWYSPYDDLKLLFCPSRILFILSEEKNRFRGRFDENFGRSLFALFRRRRQVKNRRCPHPHRKLKHPY